MASFAQLRPDELLVETERAVGDAALHALHMDLIESRGELAALERARTPALPRCLDSRRHVDHTCLDLRKSRRCGAPEPALTPLCAAASLQAAACVLGSAAAAALLSRQSARQSCS